MNTENSNNQLDLSFEQLIEASNFSLEEPTASIKPSTLEINSLDEEEELEEEKVVEAKVKEVEEPVVAPIITLDTPKTIYAELVKEKLASGEFEDVLVGEEGSEVKLSELENVDEETYKAVLEDAQKTRDENIKNNFISVENLTDTQKSLINIIKNGDLEKAKELFDNPQQLQEPFQGYDSSDDGHNEQVLGWYYEKVLGHSKKEATALVNTAKEDSSLDSKAIKIVEHQKHQFAENIKKQEAEVQEEKRAEAEKIKNYRKDLTISLKEEGLSDIMAKKFVDVATKYNQEGELEIDTIYDEWMSDPKKAKELIYFMLDNESYLKKATSETKKAVHQDILKKVNIVRDNTKVSKTEEKEEVSSSPFDNIQFNKQ